VVAMCVSDSGMSCAVIFFFQAEDGIRDRNVTGVQTCALPISFYRYECWHSDMECGDPFWPGDDGCYGEQTEGPGTFCGSSVCERSEERRVGKECRWGWARDGEKDADGDRMRKERGVEREWADA